MKENRPTTKPGDQLRLNYLGGATLACTICFLLVIMASNSFSRLVHGDEFMAFHLLVEFASGVVSFGIFTIGWFGYKQRPDMRNLGIAMTFFMVGILDFIHALSFEGMPDFLTVNSLDKSATFLIAARLIGAAGLLVVPLLSAKKPPRWLHPRLLVVIALSLITALVFLENFTDAIPPMFVEGKGLTPLKTGLEYLVMLLDLAVIVVLWKRPIFSIRSTTLLQTAMVIGIFAELASTLYGSAYDPYNFLGHAFMAASYYFILRAIFVSSLQQPYLELNQSREDLERSFDSIGLALSSGLELKQTLNLIVRLASDLLHSPHALVALQQNDTDTLDVLATHGLENAPVTIAIKGNLVARVWRDREPVWIDEMNEALQPHPPVMGGGDFHSAVAAPILKDEVILGEIAVYSNIPGAFGRSEARLLASFAGQAALAIENAHLYQNEMAAKEKIQKYVSQLSILHEIGLSLNRETDRNRLLKRVLYSAAELTGAGVGIMTLIRDGRTEIISEYFAPWYGERCQTNAISDNFHLAMGKLVGEADACRFTRTADLETLPPGHINLDGLLIGSLRDTRGKIEGYFMLSSKIGEADFSPEDERLISLLAAQSSVALVSAESFEKEHRIADTLQSALLPAVPGRQDVEVGLLYHSSGSYGKIGGDFYDFVEIDQTKIAVIVGDVCGKGLDAATYTAMIKYMLRAYLGERLLPGDCLSRLNNAVYDQVPLEKFITAGLAIIDTAARVVTYSSAGHPRPCVCHEDKVTIFHSPYEVPLGVLPDHKYASTQISLADACSIIMYSDGLIEARPEDGEPFGEQRLIENIAKCCHESAQRMATDVLQSAVEYSGGAIEDDIALVVVKLVGGPNSRDD